MLLFWINRRYKNILCVYCCSYHCKFRVDYCNECCSFMIGVRRVQVVLCPPTHLANTEKTFLGLCRNHTKLWSFFFRICSRRVFCSAKEKNIGWGLARRRHYDERAARNWVSRVLRDSSFIIQATPCLALACVRPTPSFSQMPTQHDM